MNNIISISSIIIIYEIIYLILYYIRILSIDLISPLIIINIFIIMVMYVTDCKVNKMMLYLLTIGKILLLICVLKISKISVKNYFIGLFILLIYYLISDINIVYNCNILNIDLFLSLLFSSLIYFIGWKAN